MQSLLKMSSLIILLCGLNVFASAKNNSAIAKATKPATTAAAAEPEAALGDDGKFGPQALDVLPDKKIEEVDLSAQADQAIREAAAKLAEGATTDAANPTTEAAIEKDGANGSASIAKAAKAASASQNRKETEIPVLANFGPKKEAIASPWARITLSFLIIGALATGLILFSKWYSRRSTGTKDTNKIKVLTQHFLGPKKSLAIVRVAGETILIGVTDQNISMIKSLALLDEDIPEGAPTNFGQTMIQADRNAETRQSNAKKAPVVTAESVEANYDQLEDLVVSNIKDKVFTKLKNLRPL